MSNRFHCHTKKVIAPTNDINGVTGLPDFSVEVAGIDALSGNRQNVVNRKLAKPETVRYVKLMLTSPTQDADEMTSRIYEMEVF